MKFCPFNFGGIENQNFEKAKIVILPVPFEETTDEKKKERLKDRKRSFLLQGI